MGRKTELVLDFKQLGLLSLSEICKQANKLDLEGYLDGPEETVAEYADTHIDVVVRDALRIHQKAIYAACPWGRSKEAKARRKLEEEGKS